MLLVDLEHNHDHILNSIVHDMHGNEAIGKSAITSR
jgi:hypothetical protein